METLGLDDLRDVNEAIDLISEMSRLRLEQINKVKGFKGEKAIDNSLQRFLNDINNTKLTEQDNPEAYKIKLPDTQLKNEKESFLKLLKDDLNNIETASLPEAKKLYGLLRDTTHITATDIKEIMIKNNINSFGELSTKAMQIWKQISEKIEMNYRHYMSERIQNELRIKLTVTQNGIKKALVETDTLKFINELRNINKYNQQQAADILINIREIYKSGKYESSAGNCKPRKDDITKWHYFTKGDNKLDIGEDKYGRLLYNLSKNKKQGTLEAHLPELPASKRTISDPVHKTGVIAPDKNIAQNYSLVNVHNILDFLELRMALMY